MKWLDEIEKRAESVKPGVWTRKTANTWRKHAPDDIAKLIAAVRAAEKALESAQELVSILDAEDYEYSDDIRSTLAQLQSGEFPEGDE